MRKGVERGTGSARKFLLVHEEQLPVAVAHAVEDTPATTTGALPTDSGDRARLVLPRPLVLPPRTPGRYESLDWIGLGGMGVVYAARDGRLGRSVAVKTLALISDDSARKGFWREARAAAARQDEARDRSSNDSDCGADQPESSITTDRVPRRA
jgi:hypothetical protein